MDKTTQRHTHTHTKSRNVPTIVPCSSHVTVTDGFNFENTMLIRERVVLPKNFIQNVDELFRLDLRRQNREVHNIRK